MQIILCHTAYELYRTSVKRLFTNQCRNGPQKGTKQDTFIPSLHFVPFSQPCSVYFVSNANAMKFNGKDSDYRECNRLKLTSSQPSISISLKCWRISSAWLQVLPGPCKGPHATSREDRNKPMNFNTTTMVTCSLIIHESKSVQSAIHMLPQSIGVCKLPSFFPKRGYTNPLHVRIIRNSQLHNYGMQMSLTCHH